MAISASDVVSCFMSDGADIKDWLLRLFSVRILSLQLQSNIIALCLSFYNAQTTRNELFIIQCSLFSDKLQQN